MNIITNYDWPPANKKLKVIEEEDFCNLSEKAFGKDWIGLMELIYTSNNKDRFMDYITRKFPNGVTNNELQVFFCKLCKEYKKEIYKFLKHAKENSYVEEDK